MEKQCGSNAFFDGQHHGHDDPPFTFITFSTLLNTMRLFHAICLIGQKSMFLVLENLFLGDLDNIIPTIIDAMGGGGNCLSKLFTDVEILKLQEGNPSSWDVTLLYKVDQIICGLAPMNSQKWTMNEDSDKSLEKLLHDMKQLRNHVTHNFHKLILSDIQLETALDDVRSLAMDILNAVIATTEEREIDIGVDRVEAFKAYVDEVIVDVRQQIVET